MARDAGERGDLARRAERLRAAAHPGVAEVVASDEHDGVLELVVAQPHGPRLDRVTLALEEVAGVVAAVAGTVADLHSRDTWLGGVGAHAIVLEGGVRPVIVDAGDGTGPSDDIAALGDLLRELLAAAGPAARHQRKALDALQRLASETNDADPARRPSARRLAGAVAFAVPNARLPGTAPDDAAPDDAAPVITSPRRTPPRRPPRSIAAAAAASAIVVAVALTTHAAFDSAADRPPASVPATRRPPACPTVTDVQGADVDGDGCDEHIVREGDVLVVGTVRYRVGTADDELVTGDWDCDGRDTLALFRPSTGAVHRFDAWPASEVAPAQTRAVPGAVAVTVDDVNGDGCDDLVVHRDAASSVIVSGVAQAPPER